MIEDLGLRICFLVLFIIGLFTTFIFILKIKDNQEKLKLIAQLFILVTTISAMFLIYLIGKQ